MKKQINSLYIHIPFCKSICDYCDFAKLQYFRNFAVNYLSALKNEIDYYKINQTFETIYVGGGTPTSLDNDLLEQLLIMIQPFRDENTVEFTFECNVDNLNKEKLLLLKKYGVNRLSFGVESTDDRILKSINRTHSFNDVISAFNLAKELEFNNISADLILGLPNVTEKMLLNDISNLVKIGFNHISCYSLTVHEHTVFYLKNIKEPNQDYARNCYDLINDYLTKNGFEHYEISSWAKNNTYSLHNLCYWKNKQYYGLGLGVSGYIGNLRYTNTKNFQKYLKGDFIDYKEIVTSKDEEEYYILLNLRTKFGIDLNEYKKLFNDDFFYKYKDILTNYINNNLLKINESKTRIFPTYEGMMILDQIIVDLFTKF